MEVPTNQHQTALLDPHLGSSSVLANEIFQILCRWTWVHFSTPYLVLVLRACGWIYTASAAIVLASLYGQVIQLKVQWKAVNSKNDFPPKVQESFDGYHSPYKIPILGWLAIASNLLRLVAAVGAVALLWHGFANLSEFARLSLCSALFVFFLALGHLYAQHSSQSPYLPQWVGDFIEGCFSIAEMSLDGLTAGTAYLRHSNSGMFSRCYRAWFGSLGLGTILTIILITATLLQTLMVYIIVKKFWQRPRTNQAEIAESYTRLAKFAVNLDCHIIRILALKIAEAMDTRQDRPAMWWYGAESPVTSRLEVASEQFKVKGVYENILQGWFTVAQIQFSYNPDNLLSSSHAFVPFVIGFVKIWSSASAFVKWSGVGLEDDNLVTLVLWRSVTVSHILVALVISVGSIIGLAAIPFCNESHVFQFSTWTCYVDHVH